MAAGPGPGDAGRGPRPSPPSTRTDPDHGRCLHRHCRGGSLEKWYGGRETMNPSSQATFGLAKFRRVRSLVLKESRQIFRDPSSIAIGIVLPVLLILLF